MAVDGSTYCTVHKHWPKLRPVALKPGEEVSAGPLCECEGTGRCADCDGKGSNECTCHCGDKHDAECETCDGSGECQRC